VKRIECAECARLRENSASLYAEFVAARDELAMTRKNDATHSSKRESLDHLSGRLRESYRKADFHRDQHPNE
jgi:hypothetical protein